MAGGGPLQLSLSGEQDLAGISSPDFLASRLVARRESAGQRRSRHPNQP